VILYPSAKARWWITSSSRVVVRVAARLLQELMAQVAVVLVVIAPLLVNH
jgi:hypothetical protein